MAESLGSGKPGSYWEDEEAIPPFERVNLDMLGSALGAPQWRFEGAAEPYPTLAAKAAVLMHSLARNHAWPNGNKRMALVCAMLFLAENGKWWSALPSTTLGHICAIVESDRRDRDAVIAYLTTCIDAALVEVPAE